MIAPYRIVYNKFDSRDFDVICDCAFDSDSGETETYLNRESVSSESHDGSLRRTHSYKYSDVLAPKITFIKDGFGEFSMDEARRIHKWLTSKNTPSFLDVYFDDSEAITYSILGGFSEIVDYKIANNRTIGIVATFESVAPYAFSALTSLSKDMSDPTDNTLKIHIETDEATKPIYPKITVKHGNSIIVEIDHVPNNTETWLPGTVYHYDDKYYWLNSDNYKIIDNDTTNTSNIDTTSVVITNTHTDEYGETKIVTMNLVNDVREEVVVIDGANKTIVSDRTSGRIFGDSFSWNWLPLFDGDNTISVVGNCEITVEWRSPMKVGEW